MSKNRELKEAAVAEIVEKVKASKSIVLCSYSGLTVEQVTNLRKICRESDVHYCVLKNRLVKLAFEQCGITGMDDLLNGPNAFIFSNSDAVTGPKVVSEFIDKNKLESLKITGGVLDNQAVDVATVKKLATLPSREQLLAKLLGSMTNVIGNFVRVVEAYRKQKAGEE